VVGAESRIHVVEALFLLSFLGDDIDRATVVPRPAKEDPGPRRISTCSVKKFSRTLTPGSRTPSMKTSLRASKPRMKKRSPNALPPSPLPSVTPAVLRIACLSVVAFLSSRTSLVSTVIDFGVFRIGSGNFPEACSRSPLYGAAGSA
jgi:hypothetical protein